MPPPETQTADGSSRVLTVLVTRATGQAQGLLHSIETLGLNTRHLPCLAIEALDAPSLGADLLSHEAVLLTSPNAVEQVHRQCPFPWATHVLAIGGATAAQLAQLGQPVDRQPEFDWTSEGFLELFDSLGYRSLLIVKGEGGRDYLRQALTERGIDWAVADVYRRTLPDLEHDAIAAALANPAPDVISITSNAVLENLMALAAQAGVEVPDVPLVVNHARQASLARELGFSAELLVADAPGDAGQLLALQEWLAR